MAAHTHTRTHTRTHTHTHGLTRTGSVGLTHTHTGAHTHGLTHTRARALNNLQMPYIFQTMEHSCITKVDCHVIEDRQTNKMWLVKQLEMTRILLLEDLKVG